MENNSAEEAAAVETYEKAKAEAESLVKGARALESGEDVRQELLAPIEKSTIFSSIKLMAHLDRLALWQAWDGNKAVADIPLPVTVDIDPTRVCNSMCPSCTFANYRDDVAIDGESFFEILEQVKAIGAKAVVFTGGGEPLLNDFLLRAITHANQLGIDVGIITNGLTLDRKTANYLIANDNVKWIRISLNAGTPAGYAKASGLNEASFFRLLRNMKCLAAQKAAKNSAISLGASFLTRTGLLEDIPIATALTKAIGFSYIQFKPFEIFEGRGGHGFYEDVEISNQLFLSKMHETPFFRVMASRVSFYKTGHGMKSERNYSYCHAAHFNAVIGADKKVYVCCHTKYDPDFEIGDLSVSPLKEIWQSEKRRKTMLMVDLKKCLPYCRLHEANELIAELQMIRRREHLNFI